MTTDKVGEDETLEQPENFENVDADVANDDMGDVESPIDEEPGVSEPSE